MSAAPISQDSVVARAADLLETEIDGESVVMTIARGRCYGFDPIGTHIWSLLVHPMRVDDMCSKLIDEYEVDAETCRQDVTRLLSELVHERLVIISDEQAR